MVFNKTIKSCWKKAVAVICAIAMTLSSVTVYDNTANAATGAPVMTGNPLIQLNNFGQGDVIYVAGLDVIKDTSSYNLYVDGVLWGTVANGANLDISNFASGSHLFQVSGVNEFGESEKSQGYTITIPEQETVVIPDVTDGTELLQGLSFADADTTDNEASEGALWMELSQNNLATFTNNGDGSVSVAVPEYTDGEGWATQLKQNQIQLIKDKWYVAKCTVTSDVDKYFQLMVQHNVNWSVFKDQITEVKAGTTEDVEMVFQASQTTNNVLFGIMMGYINDTACGAANVTISNVSLKVYNSNPYGTEETTSIDETEEPTTGDDDNPTTDEGEEPTTNEGEEPTSGEGENPTTDEGEKPTQEEMTPSPYEPDYSYLEFKEDMEGKSDIAVASLEDFTFYVFYLEGGQINITTKPDTGTQPIWPDFSDITLNGEPVNTDEWYADKGATIIIPVSRSGLIKDKYNVLEATSAVTNERFHLIIRYGNPPVDPNKPIETTTISDSQQETTTYKSPVDTEVESTTRIIEYFELQDCLAVSAYQEFAGYRYNITPGIVAYIGRDPADRNHIQVKSGSGPSTGTFTIAKQFKGLIPGVEYIITVDLTPSEAKGTYKVLGDSQERPLVEGTTKVSYIGKAYNMNGVGQIDFSISLLGMGKDVILDIDNPTIREANQEDHTTTTPVTTTAPETTGAEITTVLETTEQEVTTTLPETTVAKETTTGSLKTTTVVAKTTAASGTTVKPTTAASTTKADTTTVADDGATETVKAPAKAKIKKINAKKKAAKVLKIKIAKVKGADGYQVQISKAKKFKKKNILVKKFVNKAKPSIKSKKIKNKKKLFIRVRAFKLDANGKKVYGKWSKIKKVRIS